MIYTYVSTTTTIVSTVTAGAECVHIYQFFIVGSTGHIIWPKQKS